jgi:glycosyltransferase involved in cell wall biosynthesis
MRKILWLVSWYPHEGDWFNGDFVQRQAMAVSLEQPLLVIFVGKSEISPFKNETLRSPISKNLREERFYYPSNGKRRNPLAKIRSVTQYLSQNIQAIRGLKKKNEMPDLVHVHVAMKAGLIALYLKWWYRIPYILTEHWSGYYPHSRDSLFTKSFPEKFLTRLILRNASRILPVSQALGKQIDQYWSKISFHKIPNVVDTRIFFPAENRPEKFRFIHVSTLQYPKNPEGILRSFFHLLDRGIRAELVLVGPQSGSLLEQIEQSGFADQIICTGEISYQQVAQEMRKSSALLSFSYYENMPCVILEAFCTGIPVIASRVGGIPEVVNPGNGILISPGNERELMEAMEKLMLTLDHYDPASISKQASQTFSFQTIGQQIILVYDEVLQAGHQR